MKLLTYSLLILLSATIIACNSEAKVPTTNKKVEEENVSTAPEQSTDTTPRARLEFKEKVKGAKDIANFRSSALGILNFRIKNFPQTYAIVEAGTWQYEFVYDGVMSAQNVFKGVWVDFKNDHTYTYGKNNQVQGSGKYNYHLDRGELLMIDNDSKRKPYEWEVKSVEDVMILIGTETYRDKHIQMKLTRQPDAIQQIVQ